MSQNNRLFFTEHVRMLEADVQPSADLSTDFFDKLKSAVVGELKRRSLWRLQPARLGVYGVSNWSEPGALDELVADCYVAVILERLPSLAVQLRRKENIEGLVFRNIRNYLYEQQRRHDPLGFRTFRVLRSATQRAIDGGKFRVSRGDAWIRNSTWLAANPVAATGPGGGEPMSADRLREMVPAWLDDTVWPGLVSAQGRALERVELRLAEHLSALMQDGCTVIFQDLVNPLKNEVRRRWQALWSHSEDTESAEDMAGDVVRLVQHLRPRFGYEERQAFEQLLDCLDDAIERVVVEKPSIADYLWRLWSFLRLRIADEGEEQVPSRRRLAELLEIPRNRMTGLFTCLAESIDLCRDSSRQGQNR